MTTKYKGTQLNLSRVTQYWSLQHHLRCGTCRWYTPMLKRFGCSKTYSVSFKSNSHVHYFVSLLLIFYQLWYKKPFYFSDFVVFQIVGGEIFPESKQDDDDPLQMGGDFTLNRLPDLLTNWQQHFWTKCPFENVGLFPPGLVASSSATRARTRTTDQTSNKYWTLLKQDSHNSFQKLFLR